MDWYVNEGVIPFVSTLVLKGDDVLDQSFHGSADHASEQPLNAETIFRMHSSTKIVCSIAAMTLWEQGGFKLDDPLEKFMPEFGGMQVLKANATAIDETEPAHSSISSSKSCRIQQAFLMVLLSLIPSSTLLTVLKD